MIIADAIKNKSFEEKTMIKSVELAKIGAVQKIKRPKYYIQVLSIKPFTTPVGSGGIEVLARVWDKTDTQIGFGLVGEVDIERFLIINPPVLVDAGTTRPTSHIVGGRTIPSRTSNFKQDLTESILKVLEISLDSKRQKHPPNNIVRGKIGDTTTTAYSDAGGDGDLESQGQANWATARDATTADFDGSGSATRVICGSSKRVSTLLIDLSRGFIPFDISATPDAEDITSADYKFTTDGTAIQDANGWSVVFAGQSQASNTNLVTTDYDNITKNSPTEFATRKAASTIAINTQYTIALNSDAFAAMDKAGWFLLGARTSLDVDNTEPTAGGDSNYFFIYYADEAGTTKDPVVVIESSLTQNRGASGGVGISAPVMV